MVIPLCAQFIAGGVATATINSLIEETHMIKSIVQGTKNAGHKVKLGLVHIHGSTGPMMTMGMVGIAEDRTSKVLVGVGVAGLVTALVVTPVVWVKAAIGVSLGAFTVGFVRGVRKSFRTTNELMGKQV